MEGYQSESRKLTDSPQVQLDEAYKAATAASPNPSHSATDKGITAQLAQLLGRTHWIESQSGMVSGTSTEPLIC